MTDVLAVLDLGLETFGARVHRIRSEDWDAPTPCADWTVADLVAHLVDEQLWVPPLLNGHALDVAGQVVDAAKRSFADDRVEQWDAAALASARAFHEPGAIERTAQLSAGPTPVADYAGEVVFDLAVHSWDLGIALGITEPLPDELVRTALALAERAGDLSASGVFDPPQPVPDGASDEQRLVALTGRRPR
ncbi:MAG: TIGR03086 family metal-binding protein [Actinomycetota bacterium]